MTQPQDERLRLILETANDAFVAIDEHSRIIDWNRQAEVTFGWPREEAIGRRLQDTIMPPAYRGAHERGLERYLRTGEGPVLFQRVELSALTRDGRELPVEITIWPVRAETLTFNAFLRDITERRRNETFVRLLAQVAQAANELDRLDAVLQVTVDGVCAAVGWPVGHVYLVGPGGETVPIPIWHLEDPHAFEVFRAVTERTVLAPGAGLPGQVLTARAPVWIEDVNADASFPRARVATDIGVRAAFGFPVVVRDEMVAVLEFFTASARPPDPQLLEVMGQIGTQLGRVVERERAAQERAELDRLKDQFLSGVSHELRTPLTAILGFTTTVLSHWSELGEDAKVELLGRVDTNAAQLNKLVDQLLDLSLLQTGAAKLSPHGIDVRSVLDDVMSAQAEAIHERVVRVRVNPGLRVLADGVALNVVLSNLVSNAVKYSPPGSVVEVSASHTWEEVVLEVRDQGPGIPSADVERIFDRFYQGVRSSSRSGTGVGLSIARRYVEMLGGRIWVASDPRGGSVFRVALPAARAVQARGA